MSHDDLDRITWYLSGTLSPVETAETERWIEEEETRKAVANDLRRSQATLLQMRESQFSIDELVSGVNTRIHARPARVPLSLVRSTGTTSSPAAFTPAPVRKWTSALWVRVAAVVVVIMVGVYGTTQWTTAQDRTESVRTTGRGERATIQLADGSTVILGAQSKLRYAYPFGDRDREVYLEGEAYFTVTSHTSRPFIVYTAHAATQVLGTAFLVRAHPSDRDVQVVVNSGKVVLRPSSAALGSGTVLAQGDLGRITEGGLMTVARDVQIDPYISWTRGELIFLQTRLGDMVPELERWFDIKVILADPSLAATRITHTLDTESVDQTLAQLSEISNLAWTRSGNIVTVSTKPR